MASFIFLSGPLVHHLVAHMLLHPNELYYTQHYKSSKPDVCIFMASGPCPFIPAFQTNRHINFRTCCTLYLCPG
uniref:Uncharacterized protein n=1 Tax=Arundo donax TaxID=35708 RepID=A0A0A8ZKZ9_ARUDO